MDTKNNLVAKHSNKFNIPKTHVDKKKDKKIGKEKHKKVLDSETQEV